jgi:hypothetical protein
MGEGLGRRSAWREAQGRSTHSERDYRAGTLSESVWTPRHLPCSTSMSSRTNCRPAGASEWFQNVSKLRLTTHALGVYLDCFVANQPRPWSGPASLEGIHRLSMHEHTSDQAQSRCCNPRKLLPSSCSFTDLWVERRSTENGSRSPNRAIWLVRSPALSWSLPGVACLLVIWWR